MARCHIRSGDEFIGFAEGVNQSCKPLLAATTIPAMPTLILFLLCGQIDPTAAESVRVVIPGGRTHIIHIRDWHLVSQEDFAADTGLKGAELETAYGKHLETVLAVQASQRKILAKVKRAYVEGVNDAGRANYLELIAEQKREPSGALLLHIGAAGQLMVAEMLEALPAEGDDFRKANPIQGGRFDLDKAANEAREDAIVKRLLTVEGTAVLVLGGAHDLADNVRRLSKDCGLTEITPKGYPAN